MTPPTLRYSAEFPLELIGKQIISQAYGQSYEGYTLRGPNAGSSGTSHLYKLLEREQQFFSRLVQSIVEEGVRNPILLYSVPRGVYIRYGASREWAARQAKLVTIPALVWDWTDRFSHYESVPQTIAAIQSKFKDIPETIDIANCEIQHCPHTHFPNKPAPGRPWGNRNPGAILKEKAERAHLDRLQRAT